MCRHDAYHGGIRTNASFEQVLSVLVQDLEATEAPLAIVYVRARQRLLTTLKVCTTKICSNSRG